MNRWKVTAIIFIILFVIESLFLIWAYNVGTDMIENEIECSYDICNGYNAYIYDDVNEICYCYLDNEIAFTKYMG